MCWLTWPSFCHTTDDETTLHLCTYLNINTAACSYSCVVYDSRRTGILNVFKFVILCLLHRKKKLLFDFFLIPRYNWIAEYYSGNSLTYPVPYIWQAYTSTTSIIVIQQRSEWHIFFFNSQFNFSHAPNHKITHQ